jgi:hypothetical protein
MLSTSDYYILAAALVTLVLSVWLWFSGDQQAGLYIGLWVPSIIGFGIYLNILKYRRRS